MAYANFNLSVKVILVNDDNKFLILQAHDNGPMAGFYDLPGGRIDSHEVGVPFVDIASREVQEECGSIEYVLQSQPAIAISWLWPEGQAMAVVYYVAKYKSGEIKISEEHTGLKWIPFNEHEIAEHLTTYHREAITQYINQK